MSMRLDPIARVSLTATVVSRLQEQIQNGVLKPGDKLPSERELMASLGVGRSTMREALQSLAMMNLIEIIPGRGSFVSGDQDGAIRYLLSTARRSEEDSVRELLEFRRFLECEISALAAQRRTESDLDRLQLALQNTQRAMDNGQNILEQDLEFHSALADAAHNFVLKRVYRSTSDLLRYVRTKTMHVAETDIRAIRYHTAIFEAVLRQDPERARQDMSEHLDDFATTVAEVFGPTPESDPTV